MGLEGYTHPVGFFMGHFETDVFKAQNKLIDRDELLATQQGLDSPDYDLHHYDEAGGWVKRADDPEKDSKTSHQAAFQFYSKPEDRDEVLQKLVAFADGLKETQGPTGPIQSALVLKEVRVPTMATLWLRYVTLIWRTIFPHSVKLTWELLLELKAQKTSKLFNHPARFQSSLRILNRLLQNLCCVKHNLGLGIW